MLRHRIPQGGEIDTIEQPLARAQQHRRDGDVHLINQAQAQILLDDVHAATHVRGGSVQALGPAMQRGTAYAQWMGQVLIRPGTIAVQRNGEAFYAKFGHGAAAVASDRYLWFARPKVQATRRRACAEPDSNEPQDLGSLVQKPTYLPTPC